MCSEKTFENIDSFCYCYSGFTADDFGYSIYGK